MAKKRSSRLLVIAAFSILLVAATVFAIFTGSVSYSWGEIITVLFSGTESKARDIIVNIRLPRVLIALLVGANLAVAGAYMQSVMRNPMADPGIIGVSTGAALASVTIMLVFPSFYALVPVAAFVGGSLACAVVFALSWRDGAEPVRMILSGVAVNALLGGGVSLLSILYSDRLMGVLQWMNGSLSAKSLLVFYRLLPFSVLGLVLAAIATPFANMLLLGDDTAKSLGIHVNATRLLLSALAAYLTGISIATVGLVGFIGLIIPHFARLLVGADYKVMIPLCALMGSFLLVIADCVARTAFSPTEIPVGIVMSVIGGPFFVWLLRSREKV